MSWYGSVFCLLYLTLSLHLSQILPVYSLFTFLVFSLFAISYTVSSPSSSPLFNLYLIFHSFCPSNLDFVKGPLPTSLCCIPHIFLFSFYIQVSLLLSVLPLPSLFILSLFSCIAPLPSILLPSAFLNYSKFFPTLPYHLPSDYNRKAEIKHSKTAFGNLQIPSSGLSYCRTYTHMWIKVCRYLTAPCQLLNTNCISTTQQPGVRAM